MTDDIWLWPTPSPVQHQSIGRIIKQKARKLGKTSIVFNWLDIWTQNNNIMKLREVKGEWHVVVEEPKAKVEWCRETLGEGGRRRDLRWNASWVDLYNDDAYALRKTATLMFRDKEAAALFRLRFAGEQ